MGESPPVNGTVNHPPPSMGSSTQDTLFYHVGPVWWAAWGRSSSSCSTTSRSERRGAAACSLDASPHQGQEAGALLEALSREVDTSTLSSSDVPGPKIPGAPALPVGFCAASLAMAALLGYLSRRARVITPQMDVNDSSQHGRKMRNSGAINCTDRRVCGSGALSGHVTMDRVMTSIDPRGHCD